MHLTPPIRCCTIVCGPEGVAAPVILRSRNLHAPLAWTAEASTAIALLKTDLSAAAALTAPDYKNKFHLDVSEREGFTSSVLFQKQEGERRVLMHYSSKLDHIEVGQSTCSRYVAAVAKAIEKTAHSHHPSTNIGPIS